MPYITQEKREILDHGTPPLDCGELNYVITKELHKYLWNKSEKYQTYNDILGALEGAKLEIYRRMVAPYEAAKIKENGDL